MHKYSSRIDYKIIFGGAPEAVFPKLGLEPAESCGCGYMSTLNQRLDSFVDDWQERWAITEPSIEQYCCTPGKSYSELNSYGRTPSEGELLISMNFKNKQHLLEIIRETAQEFGMELKYLDKRIGL